VTTSGAGAPSLLSLRGVTHRFGAVGALHDASLHVRPGTVHALLGENGAGKTTLMRVAFGLLTPDQGSILVRDKPTAIASPAAALALGIGMVHQHFTLVPAMTVAENVALGGRGVFRPQQAAERVGEVATRAGLTLDPLAIVNTLSVGAQQRCEIVKALARDVSLLILDEPTAVLAPAEAADLLQWLRTFASDGHAVVLITHKLRDALSIADDVTVLRRGRTVLAARAGDTTQDDLRRAMVGTEDNSVRLVGGDIGKRAESTTRTDTERAAAKRATEERTASERSDVERTDAERTSAVRADPERADAERTAAERTDVERTDVKPSDAERDVLRTNDVYYTDARGAERVRGVTLGVRRAELVGIAAVEGGGQHELLRLLAGRLMPQRGTILAPARLGFVPEDRHRDALMLDAPVDENVALRGAGARHGRIPWATVRHDTEQIIAARDVRTDGPSAIVRTLSGGNQQKLVLGRELANTPDALIVENPSRGLDFQATAAVHSALREARDGGAAVLMYSSDLDEVLLLADRVLVMFNGTLTEVPRDRDAIGRAMLGAL